MDEDIKAKWTAALRSGEYRQTKGYLKNCGGFCCLGVLADVQGYDLDGPHVELETSHLPQGFRAGLNDDIEQDLAVRNDGGESFAEIADYIDANL